MVSVAVCRPVGRDPTPDSSAVHTAHSSRQSVSQSVNQSVSLPLSRIQLTSQFSQRLPQDSCLVPPVILRQLVQLHSVRPSYPNPSISLLSACPLVVLSLYRVGSADLRWAGRQLLTVWMTASRAVPGRSVYCRTEMRKDEMRVMRDENLSYVSVAGRLP